MSKCGYCGEPKAKGWHDCPDAVRSRQKIGKILTNIDEMMRGGLENWGHKKERHARDNMRAHSRVAGHEPKPFKEKDYNNMTLYEVYDGD